MLETLFVTIYPLTAICHIAAYLPQIRALAINKTDVTVMPLLPWIIWMGTNLMTLGYAAFHLKDFMLCFTVGITSILIAAVIGLIVYNRSKYSAAKMESEDDDIWNAAV